MNEDVTAAPHGGSPALRAQEQLEAMRKFCRYVVSEYCWGYSGEPDGGDLQDMAEKFGLIVPAIATAADAEHMEYTDVGDTIYRFADWLNEPRGLSASEGASPEAVNPAIAQERDVVDAFRIAEVIGDGDGFWRPCSGCHETAIKHLGAMLSAGPIANPVPGMSGIVSVNDVIDIIDGAIVRLEELGSPPGDVLRMELEDAGKFLSLTKATPAEPVAWQYRLIGPSGPTKWRECNDDVRAMIAETGHYDGVHKSPAELRPLYATAGNIRQRVNDGYFRRAISEAP